MYDGLGLVVTNTNGPTSIQLVGLLVGKLQYLYDNVNCFSLVIIEPRFKRATAPPSRQLKKRHHYGESAVKDRCSFLKDNF